MIYFMGRANTVLAALLKKDGVRTLLNEENLPLAHYIFD